MSVGGLYGMPGIDAIRQASEYDIIWGGDRNQVGLLQMHGMVYSSVMMDAGSSPTTDIRAGLIVGKNSTSGELEEWDADATDGTQDLIGVVPEEFSILDVSGTAVDRLAPSPIVRAPLRAASLLIQGTAFTSHADEMLARAALHGMGCPLDDDPQGFLAGASWRQLISTGDVTLTKANNYTRYLCHSADADFTLPTAQPGLKFRFFMGENFELQISAPASVFLVGNDQTADGVTYTTTGEQIGVNLEVECVNIDIAGTNTATWICTRLVTPFSTDDYFATTIDT
jgi:hypothetical protein